MVGKGQIALQFGIFHKKLENENVIISTNSSLSELEQLTLIQFTLRLTNTVE
jgi:hypothetical protein